jgi:NADP-dependent 3-hydroxy acid dehydrogenase YdfG
LASRLETALITGADGSVGREISKTLAEIGMRLALVGQNEEKLEETWAELGRGRELALTTPCDVTDRDAVGDMVEHLLAAFGSIDVLVCNPGTNVPSQSTESLVPGDKDKMIETNLTWAFNLVYHVLPLMRLMRNGLVIQISSIAAIRSRTGAGTGYSASKVGQSALGLFLGREEGHYGIRSSVIYPGEVGTPLLGARPDAVSAEPRAEILQPEDIAAAVKFLVELHPRARVPELIITPTVADVR